MAELDGGKKSLKISSATDSLRTDNFIQPKLVSENGTKGSATVMGASSFITTISKRVIRGNDVIESQNISTNPTAPLVTPMNDSTVLPSSISPGISVVPSPTILDTDSHYRTSLLTTVQPQLPTFPDEISQHQLASTSTSPLPISVQPIPPQPSPSLVPISSSWAPHPLGFIPPPPPPPSYFMYVGSYVQSQCEKNNVPYVRNEQVESFEEQQKNVNHFQSEEETSGWDYKSYYGTEAMKNDTVGAGGFNWWES